MGSSGVAADDDVDVEASAGVASVPVTMPPDRTNNQTATERRWSPAPATVNLAPWDCARSPVPRGPPMP